MANKYESLTNYISKIEIDNIGDRIVDNKSDGTPERPIQLSFVLYTDKVNNFVHDVYAFERANKYMELTNYRDILKKNNIDVKNVDVSSLDEQCVMALLIGVLRADRFGEGTLLKFFKNGSILKWLERLAEIDRNS